MKPISRTLAGLLCLTALLGAPAQAVELLDGKLDLNTYGTVGRAWLDGTSAQLYRSTSVAGPSLDGTPSGSFDTRIGLQMDVHLSDSVNVVWQGLVQRDLAEDQRLRTKWAYLQYQPSDALRLRVGRLMTPFYQISDQMYVGYAHPWARPPMEVYGLIGSVDYSEGVAARVRLPFDDLNVSLDASVTRWSSESPGWSTELAPIVAGVLNVGKGDWNARAMVAKVPFKSSGAAASATQALLNAPGATHRYELLDASNTLYYNFGVAYQSLDWFLSSEAVLVTVDGNYALPSSTAFTVTVGRYFDTLLPYLSYSTRHVRNTDPETGVYAGAGIANSFINSRKNDQSTVGLGLRYEVRPGVALKGQIDWVRVPNGQRGMFNVHPGGTTRVYTAVLEWAL